MPAQDTAAAPIPGKPIALSNALSNDSFKDLYVLHFIHKASSTHVQQKVFRGTGDFKDIVTRAKTHCENTGMRFVFVKPFISDFEEDEKKHRSSY